MIRKPKIIVGLGKTGLSCLQYLQSQNHPLIAIDSRQPPANFSEIQKKFPNVTFHFGDFSPDILLQAEQLIVSPGISLEEPALAEAIAKKIPVIGDIELFAQAVQAPVIAITGTNAKGTVTTLVGDMIKQAAKNVLLGGNIGTPALELLSLPVPDYYVMELSSFQLETTASLRPIAATILNITPDHLDRHHTMQNYIAAKQRIYQHARNIIFNRDDKATCPKMFSQGYSFGLTPPRSENEFGIIQENNKTFLAHGQQKLLDTDELFIKGQHNWANALAALALGFVINLPLEAMLNALRSFKGLTHRCEWVAEKNQVIWFDDSKGTNVGATLAALNGLGPAIRGKIIWIAGGLGKGQDFSPLRYPVKQFVRTAVLFGKDAALIEQAMDHSVNIQRVADLTAAVECANQMAQAGDIVLLSPACASWDMFRDYEQRGEMFKELVKEI